MPLPILVRVAAALAAAAALAFPAGSLAAQDFASSTIATPADLARIAYGSGPVTVSVAGSVAGAVPGAQGELVCTSKDAFVVSFSQTPLAAGVPVAEDGSFVVQFPPGALPATPCRLRFLPAGDPVAEMSAFSGPRVLARATTTAGSRRRQEFATVDLSRHFVVADAGGCGVAATRLSDLGGDDPLTGPATLECADQIAFGQSVVNYVPDPGRADLRVDGADSYLPGALADAGGFPDLPALSGTAEQTSGGGMSWDESADVVRCEHAVFPPAPDSCGTLVATGLRFTRRITSGPGGSVIVIHDSWRSTDGRAHALDLLPTFRLGATQSWGARFPWLATGYVGYSGDPSLPGPGSGTGPSSFFTRPDVNAAGVLGPTTALTFSDAPDRIEFADGVGGLNPAVKPAYKRAVPAGGTYEQSWAFSTAATGAEAAALAQAAEQRFIPPGPVGDPPAGDPGASAPPPVAVPVRCAVPRLRRLTLAAARLRLQAARCKLGAVERRRVRPRAGRRRVPTGRIARQSIAAGAIRPDGTAVAVVVQRRRRRVRSAGATAAAAHPRVRAESPVVSAGDRYGLVGRGWNLAGRCGRLVAIGEAIGQRERVRSARVARDGSFAFSHVIPGTTPPGTLVAIDVTRYCRPPGSGRLRTVTRPVAIRVARAPYACAEPLSAAGGSYQLTVAGRMQCSEGAAAVAAFLLSGSEPDGFRCGRNAGYAGGGADCLRANDPASRVEARPL